MAYKYSILLLIFSSTVILAVNAETIVGVLDESQGNKKFFEIARSLELTCRTDSNTEIIWSKKDEEKNFNVKVSDDKKSSTLIIEKAEASDAGVYSCSIKNKEGNLQSFEIEAVANVHVRIKPDDVSVVEGETLTLKCIGIGTGIMLKWVLPENISDTAQIITSENGITDDTLIIKDVKQYHRGNYTCEGSNADIYGTETSSSQSTAYVRVKDKYAALWPFILICIEVFVLCTIILIYEKRRSHIEIEDSETEPDPKMEKNSRQMDN